MSIRLYRQHANAVRLKVTNTRTLLALACNRLFAFKDDLRAAICGLFYGAVGSQPTQDMQTLPD